MGEHPGLAADSCVVTRGLLPCHVDGPGLVGGIRAAGCSSGDTDGE